jgi:lipooligosaccharide transport system permease protein
MALAATLRVFPAGAFGSRRAVHMLERNALIYRKGWYFLVSGFFEPFFYLLSLGIGLNHLIGNVHVAHTAVTYAAFVAPGMLATSAMNGSMLDATFNTFFRLRVDHTYDSVMATPLSVEDIALGELSWCLTRGSLYSVSFLVCMWALGDTQSGWAILCLPIAILTSLAFASAGMAACTFLRSWQDFDLVMLALLPMFLFSATFFPIDQYPGWLQLVVRATPLYQGVALARGCNLGVFNWAMTGHVGYLVVMSFAGIVMTSRRFRKLLTP